MNIIQSIELCDLSTANRCIREETCKNIIKGLDEVPKNQDICAPVKEAFQTIQKGEKENKDITWWNQVFNIYKRLWENLSRKTAECHLNERDRSANLRLLESILFSVKVTMLAIFTDTECEDCYAESYEELVRLVGYVRQEKHRRESSTKFI